MAQQDTRHHPWRVLAVTSLGVFIVFLDTTILNVAFETIKRDFHASQSGLSWVLNAYALVFAGLLIPSGRIADRIGRRRTFLIGTAIFAVTSAMCGLSLNTGMLVGARALQAVGAALLVPSSLSLLLPAFPLEKRATAVSLWGAMGAVAAASGPTLGALLIEYVHWRAVFLVNVPVCALAYALTRRVVSESRDPDAAALPSRFGVFLVIAVPGLVSLGVVEGPDWGWGSARIVACFVASGTLGLVLVAQIMRSSRPVVDPVLFEVRAYTVANLGMLLFAAAFFATTLSNIIFLQQVWGYSVLHAALAVTPAPLMAAVAAGPAGALCDRFGHRVAVVPGGLIFALSQLLLIQRLGFAHHYATVWLPSALLVGLAIGLSFPTWGAAASAALPPSRFAVGSAVNSTFRQLGGVIGVSLFVAVLGAPTVRTVLPAFERVWYVTASLAAASALVGLVLNARRGSAPESVPAPVAAAAAEPALAAS